MRARAAEDYPALVTNAVLDAYARYAVARSLTSAEEEQRQQPHSTSSRAPMASLRGETPSTVEEAFAPLELLYGKTALSAIGIALHGAEPVIRYVERVDGVVAAHAPPEEDGDTTTADDEEAQDSSQQSRGDGEAVMPPARTVHREATDEESRSDLPPISLSQQALQRARCLYHVGEHTLFSPFYCPCSAYAYQSVQRQEAWCCKHLLALQLALRIEATGLPQDNLRVRVVSPEEYEELLQNAL